MVEVVDGLLIGSCSNKSPQVDGDDNRDDDGVEDDDDDDEGEDDAAEVLSLPELEGMSALDCTTNAKLKPADFIEGTCIRSHCEEGIQGEWLTNKVSGLFSFK